MYKKLILLILIFFITSCSSTKTGITVKDNKLDYGEEIYLYDLIKVSNGKIITDNYKIDTMDLKSINISIKYENQSNKVNTYSFKVSVIDDTPPKMFFSSTYYTEKGKEIDILDKVLCGDNYDKEPTCAIEGTYNINIVGEYNLKLSAIDSSGNKAKTENIKLIVQEKGSSSNYTPVTYKIEDVIQNHKNSKTMIGIDVSAWQQDIDWEEVKKQGIEFAMLRIGYGYDNQNFLDKYFKKNLKGAKKNGIKVGGYFYSYASTKEEVINHAKWIINILDEEKLDLPIAFDWEIWDSFNDYKLNFVELNEMAKAFMDELQKNGYKAMNYGSTNYLREIWNLPNYPTWLAHYTTKTNYNKDYYIWQFTNKGLVDGIKGYVDLDILYKKEN